MFGEEGVQRQDEAIFARRGEKHVLLFVAGFDTKDEDPVTAKLTEFVRGQPWIEDAVVRVRERGREFTAEAHVVPRSDQLSVEEVSRTGALACKIDPRLADVTIAPVKSLPEDVAKARQPEHA
jgi:tetrahydromethanopterin S-methyltransferase subunit A